MINKIKIELELVIPGDSITALKRLDHIKSGLIESGWKVRVPGLKIISQLQDRKMNL